MAHDDCMRSLDYQVKERERERGPGTWGKVYSDIDHIQFPAPHFGPVALSG